MQRSSAMLSFLAQRRLFGMKGAQAPTSSPAEAAILLVYGIGAGIYRVILFVSITLYLMGQMFALGLFLAAWTAAMWFILPLGKLVHFLAASPVLAEKRGRAILATLAGFALLFAGIGLIPAPDRRRASGVVESTVRSGVYFDVEGFVLESRVRPGTRVGAGDVLVTVQTDTLEAQLRLARAQLEEIESKRRQAIAEQPVMAQVAEQYALTVQQNIRTLEGRLAKAVVRAPHAGVVVGDPKRLVGSYVKPGEQVCEVVDDAALRVTAVITQPEATWITRDDYRVEARLATAAHQVVPLVRDRVIAAGTHELPHESMGYSAGGAIETMARDESGRVSRQPVFKGYFFGVENAPGPIAPGGFPGERVTLRFTLPSRPLLAQWIDRLEKTLQGRAKV